MKERVENPFGDLIVQDPRVREPSVAGLNERPLMRLLESFEKLAGGETPRPLRSGGQAMLVTSADPGYGKSHLIGRLFHALNGRATLVYVPPFQNAANPFGSLLLTLVRELQFPLRAEKGRGVPIDQPTQLDLLAHAVLTHLLADLSEGDFRPLAIETPPETVRLLREDAVAAFARGSDPWAGWLGEHWETLEPFLEQALARRGVELARPASWLRVLRSYAFHPAEAALRRSCLDWLLGQPLERDEAERLGLRVGEIPMESSPAEANALARQRLEELCQLSCFHQPVVFCFDQTEVYGHQPALARAFGLVIATLVSEARNHLTLITANQDPWTARILPNLEVADAQRIAQPPLALEGLNRAQAVELARLRMAGTRIEPRRVEAFLRGPWLGELFAAETSQVAPRVFLQRCKERWSKQPIRDFTLRELFEQRRERLLGTPKRHAFEPDPLQWLVEVGARGLPGVEVRSIEEGYFAVEWRTPERVCLFGFLPGSHWRQWRAVAQAAERRHQEGGALPAKAIFFRGPEQPVIPGPHWVVRGEIEAAQRSSLQVIVLEVEDLAVLYAGRDLYALAAQGDVAYSPEEVVEFLHSHLHEWWERLTGPIRKDATADLGAA